MPELPEVETVRGSLEQLVGSRILKVMVREQRLRQPVDRAALERGLGGRRILAVRRRAKYLLIDVEGDVVLLVHLGMTGKLRLVSCATPYARHDHVAWELSGQRELRFNDARRFGLVAVLASRDEALHPLLADLGEEPLSHSFTGAALFRATRGRMRPLKTLLMDSRCVVGVGNIYASESLFRARLHPALSAGRLSLSRCNDLVRAIRAILRSAIAQGGTTLRDFSNTNGEAGYFAVRLQVYGREGEACPRCGQLILRIVQAGRSTFFCRGCQKR